MLDDFVLLALPLLLPVVALLRFVGCNAVFGIDPTSLYEPLIAVNCGGPGFMGDAANWYWQGDAGTAGTAGERFYSSGGSPFTQMAQEPVKDGNGDLVSAVYGTCRFGSDFSYTFTVPKQGDYSVTLKFAEISPQVGGRIFDFTLTGDGGSTTQGRTNYDISTAAGGDFIARDETFPVTVDASQTIVVQFTQGQADFPLINGIEIVG